MPVPCRAYSLPGFSGHARLTPPTAGRTLDVPPSAQRPIGETASVELHSILGAADPAAREAAWDALIGRHSRLLLAVARSLGGGHDDVMDCYAYVLEKLRENDFHRLTAFSADGRTQFSTWLTIAARRLCVDRHRSRYGRSQPVHATGDGATLRLIRRRLADNVGADVDTDLLPDSSETSVENETVRSERDAVLRAAVAALPPRDRLLLALRLDDGLSASRIAGLVGMPTPFHVYRRVSAVLSQLRVALTSRGIDGVDG